MRHNHKEKQDKKNKVKEFKMLAYVLITFAFTISTVTAQTSINATGGNASGSGGSLSYSVGQVVYTTSTSSFGSVAQGVQHAYEIFTVGIKETELNISLIAFPNPTTDNLTLQIQDYNNEKLSYQLFDMQGKLLTAEQIQGNETKIDMEHLAKANYFLNVINQNSEKVKSFKIIKN